MVRVMEKMPAMTVMEVKDMAGLRLYFVDRLWVDLEMRLKMSVS